SHWRFIAHADLLRDTSSGQVALLATPAEVSMRLAPPLLAKGLSVVDLSGAFRLPATEYPEWYGHPHESPEWVERAEYGLVELFAWPKADVRLVANPGCYATAAILAAAPLVKRGLVEGPLFVDGKSGTTGAGRKADEGLSFSEVSENVRPYRLGRHQHTPEIEQALGRIGGRPIRVSFTPQLVPMSRGLLVTVHASLREGLAEPVIEAYRELYGKASLIRLLRDRPPETAAVRNTPFTDIFAHVDARTSSVTAIAALDNLVKGAAGQAVQNLNRLLELPPETGLVRRGTDR
ncbi:MAG: N-acetyl-gamma-glutamyl-phosphate reductase, partial [Myxococcales bacterium]|nr:N-acetyl-gamma-glutamyl-phosphate reductase [Myxococcales bacterium]